MTGGSVPAPAGTRTWFPGTTTKPIGARVGGARGQRPRHCEHRPVGHRSPRGPRPGRRCQRRPGRHRRALRSWSCSTWC